MSDVLHLILQKKYFDQILSGEKKTEVRSFTDFYVNRLCRLDHKTKQILGMKKFDHGVFQLGYSKNAPQIKIELGEIYCEGDADETGQMIPEKTNFYIEIKSILKDQKIINLNTEAMKKQKVMREPKSGGSTGNTARYTYPNGASQSGPRVRFS